MQRVMVLLYQLIMCAFVCVRARACVFVTVQLLYTIQHKRVLIISPLRTIDIFTMISVKYGPLQYNAAIQVSTTCRKLAGYLQQL